MIDRDLYSFDKFSAVWPIVRFLGGESQVANTFSSALSLGGSWGPDKRKPHFNPFTQLIC